MACEAVDWIELARVSIWHRANDHGNECSGSMKCGEIFLAGPVSEIFRRRNLYHVFITTVVFDWLRRDNETNVTGICIVGEMGLASRCYRILSFVWALVHAVTLAGSLRSYPCVLSGFQYTSPHVTPEAYHSVITARYWGMICYSKITIDSGYINSFVGCVNYCVQVKCKYVQQKARVAAIRATSALPTNINPLTF
jgi:hypothetical protein